MPTRVVIHSSLVSTIFDNISLSSISSGTYDAMPLIFACVMSLFEFLLYALRCVAVRGEGLFLDDLTAAVVSALGAYSVEHVPCATVGTQCDGGDQCLVVGAAFGRTGMRLSAFRMCHCSI